MSIGRESTAPGDRPGAFRRRPWAVATCIVGVSYAATLFLLEPTFQVDDDAEIMLVLSGYRYGVPSAETIYLNPLLSASLAWCYAAFPGVPWFGLFLYAARFAGAVVVVGLFLRERRSPTLVALLVLAFVLFELFMVLRLSYTATAISAASAGSLLHFRAGLGSRGPWPSVFGGALVALSFLVRKAVFAASAIWFLPLVLVSWGKGRAGRHALFLVVSATLVMAGVHTRTLFYAGPAWDDFWRFFELRFELHGSPRLGSPEALEAAAAVGWSPVDFTLFQEYFYADREVYTVEALEGIVEATEGIGVRRDTAAALGDVFGLPNALGLAYLVVLALVALPGMSARQRVGAVLMLGGFSACVLVLAFFERLPPRLSAPLCFGAAAWLLVAPRAARGVSTLGPGWLLAARAFGVGLAALASLALVANAVRLSAVSERSHRQFVAELERMRAFGPDEIFLDPTNSLRAERMSPLLPASDIPPLSIVVLGWPSLSPSSDAHLRKLGIEDLNRALAERPDVFLVAKERIASLYLEYMRQHYGEAPAIEPVAVVSKRRGVHVFDVGWRGPQRRSRDASRE